MFLVTIRTPFFARTLTAVDPREALKTIWAFAGQGFDLIVLDERGREVSMLQLEMLATQGVRGMESLSQTNIVALDHPSSCSETECLTRGF